MTTFTTMDEAREYVAGTLGEFSADYDADYDVEAIADAITEWAGGKLVVKAEYDDPDDTAAFWALVEANDKADR